MTEEERKEYNQERNKKAKKYYEIPENKEKRRRYNREWSKEIIKLRIELNRCIYCDLDLSDNKFRTCLKCREKHKNWNSNSRIKAKKQCKEVNK